MYICRVFVMVYTHILTSSTLQNAHTHHPEGSTSSNQGQGVSLKGWGGGQGWQVYTARGVGHSREHLSTYCQPKHNSVFGRCLMPYTFA